MPDAYKIIEGPDERSSQGRDSHVFRFRYRHGEVEQNVIVTISGTAMSIPAGALDATMAAIIATRGRVLVEDALAKGNNPGHITVDSKGRIVEAP
jgi:hypothetical protein